MKQHRQLLKKLAVIASQHNKHSQSTTQPQAVPNLASELSAVLEQMRHQMDIVQQEQRRSKQELNNYKKQVREYQSSLREMGQQLQRLRLLLPIKDQLIVACKKQISVLEDTLRYSSSSSGKRMKHSTLQFTVSRVFEEEVSAFKEKENGFNRDGAIGLGQTKPKITIRRGGEDTHRKDLEMAKLKNEVCKLRAENQALIAQIQLLRIENQHLSKQRQISNNQTQFMIRQMQKMMNKSKEVQLSQKCEQLQRYIDKLTTKVQKIDQPEEVSIWGRRTDLQLHPPTPHFASGPFGIAHKERRFDFPNMPEINESIVSMGQSISQGLQ